MYPVVTPVLAEMWMPFLRNELLFYYLKHEFKLNYIFCIHRVFAGGTWSHGTVSFLLCALQETEILYSATYPSALHKSDLNLFTSSKSNLFSKEVPL